MKIERLDAKTGVRVSLEDFGDGSPDLSIDWGIGDCKETIVIGHLSVAKAAYHVLGEWIKTKEAEDED